MNDIISRRILAVCFGISAILLTGSLLLFVLTNNNSYASTSGLNGATQSGSGQIMMDYSAYKTANGTDAYEILVWNTSTGKSMLYYYSPKDNVWKKNNTAGNLPANPLP